MKKSFLIWAGLVALGVATASGQLPTASSPTPGPITTQQQRPAAQELSRFSLDFPGGTPKALVSAIQQASGKPLNAIVPDEFVDMKIPPLKMNNVNVQQLFQALEQASRKTQAYEAGSYSGGGQFGGYRSIQTVTTSYGFQPGSGQITDDTIWYFHVEKPPMPTLGASGEPVKAVRFYSLTPYLNKENGEHRSLTVDDITTAIETGWKMLGETHPPKISYHKDTNLLIAVGEPNKLETIDAVLKALVPQSAPAAPGRVAAPKPAESKRSAESSNTGSE